jgi:succinate dehydrogenase/fumarate reductase iron-sulfur protein
MDQQNLLNVRVYRFDPSLDKEPSYREYKVPLLFEKMKILDVLRYIQEKLDYTLSFTWDCRLWNCGLCGVSVNKRPCSACLMDVKSIVSDNGLLIEPMPNYPVLKDLVIDRTVEMEKMRKVGIQYDRHSGEFSLDKIPEIMDPEKVAFFRDWYLACIDCLACNSACPAFSSQGEFIGPHLSVRLAKYLAHPTDEGNRAKQGSEGEIFRCLNCRRCDLVCPISLEVSNRTMERLKSEAVEKGYTPPAVRDFLENVYKFGNPWGLSPAKRANWAENLGVARFDSKKHEFLLYVGCTGSYDTRAQEVAKSVAGLLLKAHVSFGILGEKEISDGNDINRIGEKGLFEELAAKNIQTFNSQGVKKIVTLSPHAFNTFKNEYPALGGQYEVMHYTQLLGRLIRGNQLKLPGTGATKVTYHDSCLLGRYNSEYDAPREVLRSMPGVELLEMERIKENSFCCGGGGGNFVTGLEEGKQRANIARIREALTTGATVLAVSCPKCLIMFEDAIKTENLEGQIAAKDISEILFQP